MMKAKMELTESHGESHVESAPWPSREHEKSARLLQMVL